MSLFHDGLHFIVTFEILYAYKEPRQMIGPDLNLNQLLAFCHQLHHLQQAAQLLLPLLQLLGFVFKTTNTVLQNLNLGLQLQHA